MFLIDQPYVSHFLIQTIKTNHYKIIDTPNARALVSDRTLNWISEKEAQSSLKKEPNSRIYSVSENGLEWIVQHLENSALVQQIDELKNKVKFRDHLKTIFPDFHFKEISLEDIQQWSPQADDFPFVIKPAIGFLSIGVHIVKNEADWEAAKAALQPKALESIFPTSVLNTQKFIVEGYIEGEEYAADFYYDHQGNAVILNVLHHVFSSDSDTSDRLYITSKVIVLRYHDQIKAFLTKIGKALDLKNVPAHAEMRIDALGNILPIEINAIRFGGWCTTADLLGICLGYNEYHYFFEGKIPDWDAIFKGKEDRLFSIVILNNNSGIPMDAIAQFDYDALANDFEHPRLMRKLNHKENPLFGFVFVETRQEHQEELIAILSSDLKKYIRTKDS